MLWDTRLKTTPITFLNIRNEQIEKIKNTTPVAPQKLNI